MKKKKTVKKQPLRKIDIAPKVAKKQLITVTVPEPIRLGRNTEKGLSFTRFFRKNGVGLKGGENLMMVSIISKRSDYVPPTALKD